MGCQWDREAASWRDPRRIGRGVFEQAQEGLKHVIKEKLIDQEHTTIAGAHEMHNTQGRQRTMQACEQCPIDQQGMRCVVRDSNIIVALLSPFSRFEPGLEPPCFHRAE